MYKFIVLFCFWGAQKRAEDAKKPNKLQFRKWERRSTDAPFLVEQMEEEEDATKVGKKKMAGLFKHILKIWVKASVMFQKSWDPHTQRQFALTHQSETL